MAGRPVSWTISECLVTISSQLVPSAGAPDLPQPHQQPDATKFLFVSVVKFFVSVVKLFASAVKFFANIMKTMNYWKYVLRLLTFERALRMFEIYET